MSIDSVVQYNDGQTGLAIDDASVLRDLEQRWQRRRFRRATFADRAPAADYRYLFFAYVCAVALALRAIPEAVLLLREGWRWLASETGYLPP